MTVISSMAMRLSTCMARARHANWRCRAHTQDTWLTERSARYLCPGLVTEFLQEYGQGRVETLRTPPRPAEDEGGDHGDDGDGGDHDGDDNNRDDVGKGSGEDGDHDGDSHSHEGDGYITSIHFTSVYFADDFGQCASLWSSS